MFDPLEKGGIEPWYRTETKEFQTRCHPLQDPAGRRYAVHENNHSAVLAIVILG
jgi:hypothetical protein